MENKKAALAALVRKWCEEKDNAVRMESRMKTVIAIDSFKGSMTSMEAGNAAAAGVKAVFPDAEIVVPSPSGISSPRLAATHWATFSP